MLLQAFRLHLPRQASDRVGLLHALADPHLGKAIEAIHSDPAHRWTLDELAGRAVLSQSVFAQRFREGVGETPIGYLAQWRMMLAKDRLADGRDTLKTIANGLAYESEKRIDTRPRISVNEALTIHRLVSNAAGLGILLGYICAPEIAAGRLVHLFPEWSPPSVAVSLVFF